MATVGQLYDPQAAMMNFNQQRIAPGGPAMAADIYSQINQSAYNNPGTLYGMNPQGNSYAITYPTQAQQAAPAPSQGQSKGASDWQTARNNFSQGKGGASTATNTDTSQQATTTDPNTTQAAPAAVPAAPASANPSPIVETMNNAGFSPYMPGSSPIIGPTSITSADPWQNFVNAISQATITR